MSIRKYFVKLVPEITIKNIISEKILKSTDVLLWCCNECDKTIEIKYVYYNNEILDISVENLCSYKGEK